MRYVEAPETWDSEQEPGNGIFLAGGISNCADWQSHLTALLDGLSDEYVLLNPRRTQYPADDADAAEEQIRWEHSHLRKADAVVFWFTPPTLNPITLFEYGKCLVGRKPSFVGCHPDYARRKDIIIQTGLEKPEQIVVSNLDDLCCEIQSWINGEEFGKLF